VEPNAGQEWHGKRDEPSTDETRVDDATSSLAPDDSSRRRRRNLLSCGVFVLALCLVSGVVTVMLYDRATRKDRSTPNVVVFQYVDAVFDQRDPTEAELFECERSNGRAALQGLLDEIEEREQSLDIHISVSTGATFNTSIEGTRAHVVVDLIIAAPEANGERSRASQSWEFDLRDEDGWRVCDARRAPQ